MTTRAHRAVIEAKGKDKRGNGTAGATVTIQLTDAGDGSTRADVQTDLAVTGKPAQFGRGVMQDVSDKLLGQFIACIEGKIGDADAEPAAPTPAGGTPAQATERRRPDPAVDAAAAPVAGGTRVRPAHARAARPGAGGARPRQRVAAGAPQVLRQADRRRRRRRAARRGSVLVAAARCRALSRAVRTATSRPPNG